VSAAIIDAESAAGKRDRRGRLFAVRRWL